MSAGERMARRWGLEIGELVWDDQAGRAYVCTRYGLMHTDVQRPHEEMAWAIVDAEMRIVHCEHPHRVEMLAALDAALSQHVGSGPAGGAS